MSLLGCFGTKDQDWVLNLNIGNVMHLMPLSLNDLTLHVDCSHELSRDAMLEKIILLTISYFCVGTELRFLSGMHEKRRPPGDLVEGNQERERLRLEKNYPKEESEKW